MVECARLEIWFRFRPNVGSNPTLSASSSSQAVLAVLEIHENPHRVWARLYKFDQALRLLAMEAVEELDQLGGTPQLSPS